MWDIERVSFPTPWSRSLLATELGNPGGLYVVAEVNDRVTGYVGLWYAAEEGHICTLAVHPAWRGRGVGEGLMICALLQAIELGARFVGLEYRVSNRAAAALYRKLGFVENGIRKGYYSDTGEDAVMVTFEGLSDPDVAERLRQAFQRWKRERNIEPVIDL